MGRERDTDEEGVGGRRAAATGVAHDFTKPPERWFKLLGLVVVTKTDLLAAAAFFLAVSTAIYQGWQFINGADVALYHPDTVYVFFDRYASRRVVTRFAGQISLTNTGAQGRDAILRELSMTISVGGKKFSERWTSFALVSRKGDRLSVEPKETAHPVPVNGGSAISHTISFAPVNRTCERPVKNEGSCNADADFVSDDDFLGLIQTNDRVDLTFVGTLFKSNRILTSMCTIEVTPRLRQMLPENDRFPAQCSSVPE
jgi:hypothetical protein